MKKIICAFALAVLATGCGITSDQIRTENRQNLLKLSLGMTKQEVLGIMGTETVHMPLLGFGRGWRQSDYIETINNPYKSEILPGKEKTFDVLYYYTDEKRVDGAITDDELTPLVFDDGKLIGWGQGFLDGNIQKYEIRVR